MRVYYYMHHERVWLSHLFSDRSGIPFNTDELCWQRIGIAWRTYFMLDDSGRSTAKTHDYMLMALGKMALMPNISTVYFSLDARRGSDKTNAYAGKWLKNCPYFAERIKPLDSVRGAIVRNKGNTTEIPFKNGSLYKSYTPDWASLGENTQSDRCNVLIFNEWTSYPTPEAMVTTVEPIATHTNWAQNGTANFRVLMERALGKPLGRLTDAIMLEQNADRPDYVPRPHLINAKPVSDAEVLEIFFRGFKKIFGFDYHAGLQHDELGLIPIQTRADVELFFADYLDGDPVYGNQIVYDGSAKRPSDDCYLYTEYHWSKTYGEGFLYDGSEKHSIGSLLDKQQVGDPRYGHFNISVDDLDSKWDGIIYNSNVIDKAREQMLTEEYNRVYGGLWVEGMSHKPYDAHEIMQCRRDVAIIAERADDDRDAVFVMALDAAKGTEAMRRGQDNVNMSGKGDNAAAIAVRVGQGTADDPHSVIFGYKALDVRSDPVAVDIHRFHHQFGFNLIGVDPNGGGTQVIDSLAKPMIDLGTGWMNFEPIIPHDYVGDLDGDRCLMFMSRSEKLITEAYRTSETQSPFRGEDMLINAYHTNMRNLLEKRGVVFPQAYSTMQILALHNNGQWTDEQLEAYVCIQEALEQLVNIRYVLDKRSTKIDKRIRTTNGVFKYEAKGKKDLAMALIYALFIAEVWLKWNQSRDSNRDYLYALG